jgi:hypothetical protein
MPPPRSFFNVDAPVSRICARVAWLSKIQHKLEEYSRNSKLIRNQKTHETQRAHDQKASKKFTRFQIGGKEFAEDLFPYVKAQMSWNRKDR